MVLTLPCIGACCAVINTISRHVEDIAMSRRGVQTAALLALALLAFPAFGSVTDAAADFSSTKPGPVCCR
jgi:hypothetical protein